MYNFNLPFTLDFDLNTGMSTSAKSTKRYLSNMKGMFYDNIAYEKMLQEEDELIYEFYELNSPEKASDLAFGTSITYPGKVGNEYFMTKGHYHTILETAEVYFCISGEGYLIMESPEGDTQAMKMSKGMSCYVPPRFAHRSVNVGSIPFVTFFVFRADAGHNYGTIETKGFRKLLMSENNVPVLIDNTKWKG